MITKAILKRGARFFLLLVFLLPACSDQSDWKKTYPFQYAARTMGTSFSIKVSNLPEEIATEQLQSKIDGLLDEINGHMSTYQKDSELSLFNNSRSTDWQSVSDSLFTVLKEAQRISQLTTGAFDVTIGPLVNIWGFGPEPLSFEPPAESMIARKLKETGYTHLLLRESPKAIRKQIPELYLDLSALAKGYAVDRVAELLEEQGITDYLVEIGGEIRLKGNNIQGKSWRIAIEKPMAENRMLQKILPLSNIAIATSGDYRNFFESDGVRFSHTIDPRNGQPVAHQLASITILSHVTMEADALATALMVLGPDDGYKLADQHQIAALFIIKTDDGCADKSTAAFNEHTR